MRNSCENAIGVGFPSVVGASENLPAQVKKVVELVGVVTLCI